MTFFRTPKLALVCPCYNEALTLNDSLAQLDRKLTLLINQSKAHEDSFICVVNDGSTDESWPILTSLVTQYPKLTALNLSANVGHQKALTAGLHYVTGQCDCAISLDIDLQDDLNAFDPMLTAYGVGNHIVFGVRSNRDSDSFFKRNTAQWFYKIMNLAGIQMIYNHADFRLVSHQALVLFQNTSERNLYLRGFFASLPLQSTSVFYARLPRAYGETKYTLPKMIALAFDGISSFSIAPLRLISAIGAVIFLSSISYSAYALWIALFSDNAVPGWASTVLPIYFIGGIQLLSLGIIGEYVGKIYTEIKQRPLYHITDACSQRLAQKLHAES